jgi:hypothetical protein
VPFFLAINIDMKQSFVLATLIDITDTGEVRGNSKQRDQQRNWETVIQVLSLKTQPIIIEGPDRIDNIDFQKQTGVLKFFGEFYKELSGTQSFWAIKFTSEQNDIYSIDQLYEDFEQVPIILGLDETARFMLPLFHSYGALKNIHFFTADELNIN